MGEQDVKPDTEPHELRAFTKKLLADLKALEQLLSAGRLESDTRRIGAEQEMFLVDRRWRPAPLALEVLETLGDPHFTTELARFNLECNLDPIELGGRCLAAMEEELVRLLGKASAAARQHGAEVLLTGILPTLEKSDLSLDNMTPRARYHALNEAMRALRGESFQLRIKGHDDLVITHDNVMLEACNTSFQVHFQVTAEDFASRYNVAQAVAAPVLAAATNSPLLFGRRLWRETRIALFQQSIDTRAAHAHLRDESPRVSFGEHWVDSSVLEIFREDIARFRVILGVPTDENPFEALAAGRAPELRALRLHNGTVYRWNRPCYGISAGRPHLRIENRVLPAGPTPRDEIANAAFWLGLMEGVLQEYGDIRRRLPFAAAKENFVAAARLGLGSQLWWVGGEAVPAPQLVCERLLPLARQGLLEMRFAEEDVALYLGVIESRVAARRTGAQWLLDSLAGMEERGSRAERLAALAAATHSRQGSGLTVHEWELARVEEAGGWREHYRRVDQIMTTQLFTVNQDELVDLVAHVMHWRHIRHVPVEDNQHRLVGLVTHRSLLRLMADSLAAEETRPIAVSDIMQRQVVTVTPQTPTLEAIRVMKRQRIGCLPVVNEAGRLVGILTERDFMNVAGQILEEGLAED